MTQPQYRQQGKQCGVEYLNDANSTSNLTSKTFLKLGDFFAIKISNVSTCSSCVLTNIEPPNLVQASNQDREAKWSQEPPPPRGWLLAMR